MTKLFRILGALLCVAALVQFSTPAMAQSYIRRYALHATASGTTTVVASTAWITSCVITVSTVGTNPIQVKNKEGTAKVLFQAASTALGTIVNFNSGGKDGAVVSTGGIDVVAPATAVEDIFINYYL